MINPSITYEIEKISAHIKKLEEQIQLLPHNRLYEERNGTHYRYYIIKKDKRHYLLRSNKELLYKLCKRVYLEEKLLILNKQKDALNKYSSICESEDLSSLFKHPKLNNFIVSNLPESNSNQTFTWMQQDYPKNQKHPEQLTHRTKCNTMVRSATEAAIASKLHSFGIQFRYEAELIINDISFYPDFTILHPSTGKLYYWEHFGMLESPTYRDNYINKLRLYTSNQILPMKNLICTYSYANHPLDEIAIEQIIKDYFLECTL